MIQIRHCVLIIGYYPFFFLLLALYLVSKIYYFRISVLLRLYLRDQIDRIILKINKYYEQITKLDE